jgi:hypothetical protein
MTLSRLKQRSSLKRAGFAFTPPSGELSLWAAQVQAWPPFNRCNCSPERVSMCGAGAQMGRCPMLPCPCRRSSNGVQMGCRPMLPCPCRRSSNGVQMGCRPMPPCPLPPEFKWSLNGLPSYAPMPPPLGSARLRSLLGAAACKTALLPGPRPLQPLALRCRPGKPGGGPNASPALGGGLTCAPSCMGGACACALQAAGEGGGGGYMRGVL